MLPGCSEGGLETPWSILDGIGEANGRAEDCAEVDGALGEAVRMETGTSAA